MATDIPELQPGKKPTLLDPDFANKLIKALNGLRKMQFVPDDVAEMTTGDDGSTVVQFEVQESVPIIVNDVPGFYDILAFPSEDGGDSEQAKNKIIAALGFESKKVRAMEVTADPEEMNMTTITVLRKIETE